MNESHKRQCLIRNNLWENDLSSKLQKLQFKTQFTFLQFFSNWFYHDLILLIHRSEIKTISVKYTVMKIKILNNCKNWKKNSINNIIVSENLLSLSEHSNSVLQWHVQNVIKIDDADIRELTHIITDVDVVNYFLHHYSSVNFTAVFQFLQKYLNLKRSSEMMNYYCKSEFSF